MPAASPNGAFYPGATAAASTFGFGFQAGLIYKMTDAVRIEVGGNFFYGKEDHTFFGQFEDTSNIYVGIRTGF